MDKIGKKHTTVGLSSCTGYGILILKSEKQEKNTTPCELCKAQSSKRLILSSNQGSETVKNSNKFLDFFWQLCHLISYLICPILKVSKLWYLIEDNQYKKQIKASFHKQELSHFILLKLNVFSI